MVEDFCGSAEVTDDVNGAEVSVLSLADVKRLVNELTSIRAKKVLQLIPLDTLVRLINVLDHQIRHCQGWSFDGNEYVSFNTHYKSAGFVFGVLHSFMLISDSFFGLY